MFMEDLAHPMDCLIKGTPPLGLHTLAHICKTCLEYFLIILLASKTLPNRFKFDPEMFFVFDWCFYKTAIGLSWTFEP
jgi:hypothetical protein